MTIVALYMSFILAYKNCVTCEKKHNNFITVKDCIISTSNVISIFHISLLLLSLFGPLDFVTVLNVDLIDMHKFLIFDQSFLSYSTTKM